VQAFTLDGEFLFTFGSNGTKPGFFQYHFGIAVNDLTGFIFVADQNNNRIQIFTSEGKFQHEIQLESQPIGLYREQRLIIGGLNSCISIF